ncbi:hypothetical protein [Streptomyces sp. NPDC047141]|uniref:hypothetical protein n=1 Tax=Streptomyces sp. NPDC047141 TaxID=3155738 RepID=UPI0033C81E22
MLPLADYHRTNLTDRQLAPLVGISPATVERVVPRLRPLRALERALRPAAGNWADADVWRESALAALAAGTTVIADAPTSAPA